ncbi:hypothetical protein B0H17DRAFT_1340078, partial [Mycena rosella]
MRHQYHSGPVMRIPNSRECTSDPAVAHAVALLHLALRSRLFCHEAPPHAVHGVTGARPRPYMPGKTVAQPPPFSPPHSVDGLRTTSSCIEEFRRAPSGTPHRYP